MNVGQNYEPVHVLDGEGGVSASGARPPDDNEFVGANTEREDQPVAGLRERAFDHHHYHDRVPNGVQRTEQT